MKPHLMTLKKGIFTTWVLLSLLHLAIAQSNLVFNGGFDTNGAGWTFVNGAHFGWLGNPGYAVGLDGEPSPSNDPTASQTINSLISGVDYIVSGDYQVAKDRGGGSPTDFSFGVAIDGSFLFEAVAPTNLNWQNFSFLYTATSSSAILSLSSQINGTGVSYVIDNIEMEAVPEPNTLSSILILGIIWQLIIKSCRALDSSPALWTTTNRERADV